MEYTAVLIDKPGPARAAALTIRDAPFQDGRTAQAR